MYTLYKKRKLKYIHIYIKKKEEKIDNKSECFFFCFQNVLIYIY